MELTIIFDDKKGDGYLHGKITLDFEAKTKPILEGLRALGQADIATTIASALTKKEEPK